MPIKTPKSYVMDRDLIDRDVILPEMSMRGQRAVGRHGLYLLKLCAPWDQTVLKVGMALNPTSRLSGFTTALPFPAIMKWIRIGYRVQTSWAEKALHRALADFRTRGEWFAFSPESDEIVERKVMQVISEHGRIDESWKIVTTNDIRIEIF
jgi:hypothetical protein